LAASKSRPEVDFRFDVRVELSQLSFVAVVVAEEPDQDVLDTICQEALD
jgi:hypothetical protein